MRKLGVAHMAYAPLGQGNRGEMFELPAVVQAADAHGVTPAQVLLRFLTQEGVVAIPKSTHAERIRENLASLDFNLTDAELDALHSLDTATPLIGRAEDPEFAEFAMTW